MKQNTVAPQDARTALAALRFDELTVLLPRQEIRTLEPADDVDAGQAPAGAIGWIKFQDERWPVYALTDGLSVAATPADGHRICVLLSAGAASFALLCSEVTLLELTETPAVHPVPRAMASTQAGFHGLALYGGAVACVTTAANLIDHIRRGEPLPEHETALTA